MFIDLWGDRKKHIYTHSHRVRTRLSNSCRNLYRLLKVDPPKKKQPTVYVLNLWRKNNIAMLLAKMYIIYQWLSLIPSLTLSLFMRLTFIRLIKRWWTTSIEIESKNCLRSLCIYIKRVNNELNFFFSLPPPLCFENFIASIFYVLWARFIARVYLATRKLNIVLA